MKTTNYKISKKLAEIGFKIITNLTISNGEMLIPKYPTYDLETILEALPKTISPGKDYSDYQLKLSHNYICYEMKDGIWQDLIASIDPDESLADTAARLLILLVEKGIVKFNN